MKPRKPKKAKPLNKHFASVAALLWSRGLKIEPNHALFNRHLADLPRRTK